MRLIIYNDNLIRGMYSLKQSIRLIEYDRVCDIWISLKTLF